MPTLRPDITALNSYRVGRQLDDVARAHDLDPAEIVQLTANEAPEGPFPGVVEAVSGVLGESNRYPDNDCWDLGHALATELGVGFANILFGAGSVALLADMAIAAGGPGTKVVFGWPSFVMYRFVATWAGSEYLELPLDSSHALDLEAIRSAVGDQTRVVLLCNPNNPTGIIKPADEIEAFIESVPESVLIVVDEAYHDYVDDPRYRSEIPIAVERPNVVVLRTFSKIYGLAAHRIGYAVGHPNTLIELRKAQMPMTVNRAAQTAALASLGQTTEMSRRRADNSARRHYLEGALEERGLGPLPSQANFILFHLGDAASPVVSSMTGLGVLVRAMSGGWVRVTIGNDEENSRFIEALDKSLAVMS